MRLWFQKAHLFLHMIISCTVATLILLFIQETTIMQTATLSLIKCTIDKWITNMKAQRDIFVFGSISFFVLCVFECMVVKIRVLNHCYLFQCEALVGSYLCIISCWCFIYFNSPYCTPIYMYLLYCRILVFQYCSAHGSATWVCCLFFSESYCIFWMSMSKLLTNVH